MLPPLSMRALHVHPVSLSAVELDWRIKSDHRELYSVRWKFQRFRFTIFFPRDGASFFVFRGAVSLSGRVNANNDGNDSVSAITGPKLSNVPTVAVKDFGSLIAA